MIRDRHLTSSLLFSMSLPLSRSVCVLCLSLFLSSLSVALFVLVILSKMDLELYLCLTNYLLRFQGQLISETAPIIGHNHAISSSSFPAYVFFLTTFYPCPAPCDPHRIISTYWLIGFGSAFPNPALDVRLSHVAKNAAK